MLRQKAETRMLIGAAFPDEFVSVLRMQNAALAENGKTMVLVSLGNTLAPPHASAQMRRLLGYRGHASQLDVSVAQHMDTASAEEDFEN